MSVGATNLTSSAAGNSNNHNSVVELGAPKLTLKVHDSFTDMQVALNQQQAVQGGGKLVRVSAFQLTPELARRLRESEALEQRRLQIQNAGELFYAALRGTDVENK